MNSETKEPAVVRGCCHVYYAIDVGFSVDLKRCAGLIQEAREASGFRHYARTPAQLHLQPLPVHISQAMMPIRGRTFVSEDRVTLRVYDFGAVSVEYRIPFDAALDELADLSSELYDNQQFAADAQGRARALLDAIRPAVKRPNVRDKAEDYLIFTIPEFGPSDHQLESLLPRHGDALARIVSSNTKPLSDQQVREELSGRAAYYADDLTIVTWNAALVFGKNMDDVLAVLELANVQLRELHYLDDQLDASLQESYEASARASSVKARMRRVRELMLDGQAISEAVTNAFKPFPDAFLARVYVLASSRLGLNHFDQSIKDKLSLLNTLYTTLADEANHERSLRLEWIVIVLIAIEIVLALGERLLPWLGGKA